MGRPHKRNEAKKTKKKQKYFPECLPWHSGKRPFPECQDRTLGEDEKKLTKYNKKKVKIIPNLNREFKIMWEGLTKKLGRKNKKKQNFFSECLPWHSGKRPFPECPNRALGEGSLFPECIVLALGEVFFFF